MTLDEMTAQRDALLAARYRGVRTVELNLEPSDGASLFSETDYGPATQLVPQFVERLLAVSA